ncbi:hypothetical protein ACFLR7_04520 [Acidobacteriota bacterium]
MKAREIQTWEMERFVLGELPSSRMAEIHRLAETDPDLRERIASLQSSSRDILDRYPAEDIVPKILKRRKAEAVPIEPEVRRKPTRWRYFLLATPAAAALVLVVAVFFRSGDPTLGTRIKGEETIDMTKTQVIVYRKIDDQAEVLKNGDKASRGDLLQIAYVPAGQIYGVVFSIDGNGVVTLHYPERDEDSTLLDQESKTLLQTSYELDDAPRFERFFFVTSKSKIDAREILTSAQLLAGAPDEAGSGELTLPASQDQFSIILIKGETP